MDYTMAGLEFSKSNKHVLELQMLEIPELWFHVDARVLFLQELVFLKVDKGKFVLLNPTFVQQRSWLCCEHQGCNRRKRTQASYEAPIHDQHRRLWHWS